MKSSDKITICMISCLHPLQDDRIYWKEALSLKNHGYNVIHLGVSENNSDTISQEGIRLISIQRKIYFKNPFIDKLFRLFTFRRSIYKDLFSKCIELKADVYHFHDLQLNRIGPKLKKLNHKPKVIYDVHEPYPEIFRHLVSDGLFNWIPGGLLSWKAHRLQKKSAQHYDSIIATEENVAYYFSKFYNSNKISVVYNYPVFNIKNKGITKKEYDLIYVGGISTWRGIWELLEVTKTLAQYNNKIKVICLGNIKENRLEQQIKKYIADNELQRNFVLKSFVPFNEVPAFLEKSKLGFCVFKDNPVYHIIMPIKIFEYMTFGLPVICNIFGHSSKIISKEKCGLAVDIRKTRQISDNIIKLLQDKETYTQMSKKAIKAIESKYKWEISEKVLIDIYMSILKPE